VRTAAPCVLGTRLCDNYPEKREGAKKKVKQGKHSSVQTLCEKKTREFQGPRIVEGTSRCGGIGEIIQRFVKKRCA